LRVILCDFFALKDVFKHEFALDAIQFEYIFSNKNTHYQFIFTQVTMFSGNSQASHERLIGVYLCRSTEVYIGVGGFFQDLFQFVQCYGMYFQMFLPDEFIESFIQKDRFYTHRMEYSKAFAEFKKMTRENHKSLCISLGLHTDGESVNKKQCC